MTKTYLFYDLETTGINKCFDQILQFAAIRTDESLNELERHEFLVKLNPDTIPTPEASITHHISIEKANEGISEYEAIGKIYTLLNTPNTVSLGYNTLTFDDEFLRFSFYKNLFPAYDHQFKNGCSRMDLYPIVAAYYLFANDALIWPITQDAKVSLKLENINTQNELYLQGRVHDAMTDVIITLELARKLKKHHHKMWQFLVERFDKTIDQQVLLQLDTGLEIDEEQYAQALMVSGRFGFDEQFMLPVLNLGQHWHYKNQWCFLRLDYADLSDVTKDNLSEHFLTVNKKWGDLPLLLPAKARFLKRFDSHRLSLIKANKAYLQENPQLFIEIKEDALDFKYPQVENIDIDAALYQNGFMSYTEQNLCEHFHKRALPLKVKLMLEMNASLYQRALRVIGRLSSENLTADRQQEFQAYLEKVASYESGNMPIDYKGQHRISIPEVYKRIEQLRGESLSQEQIDLLDELEAYLSL